MMMMLSVLGVLPAEKIVERPASESFNCFVSHPMHHPSPGQHYKTVALPSLVVIGCLIEELDKVWVRWYLFFV